MICHMLISNLTSEAASVAPLLITLPKASTRWLRLATSWGVPIPPCRLPLGTAASLRDRSSAAGCRLALHSAAAASDWRMCCVSPLRQPQHGQEHRT
jgi:hypothetical protein